MTSAVRDALLRSRARLARDLAGGREPSKMPRMKPAPAMRKPKTKLPEERNEQDERQAVGNGDAVWAHELVEEGTRAER
jgi:hypothetical protein